jgi:hypothetical protein
MVYPKKSGSVAIACIEWSSVDDGGAAKSPHLLHSCTANGKAMLRGENYSTGYYFIRLPRVLYMEGLA